MIVRLPATLLHWFLAGSAAAAILFFCMGLTTYFEQRQDRPPWVRGIHNSGLVLSLAHLAGVVFFELRSDVHAAIGIGLYTVAIAIFLAAIEAAKRTRLQRSYVDYPLPDRLITEGPYRWVRHPFAVGYIMGAVAAPVAVDNVGLFLIAVVMMGTTVTAAFREERLWLASPRGDAYREYRRRTGMFFPFIGRD